MSDKNIAVSKSKDDFYNQIKTILQSARDKAYTQVNFIMVEAYWHIGQQIVEEEQKGEDRAKYGSYLIKDISKRLTEDFGKGFSQRNLRNMRQFYTFFPIWQSVTAKLSWTHYTLLLRIENEQERVWYMEESVKSHWSVRALERQIGTHYYERLLSSKEKKPVADEAKEKTKNLQFTPRDTIKDPYVLEFLDLKDNRSFREDELESGLIEKIQEFLLELGRGFAFVDRQKRIKTEHSDFYIDLVFYNYILKCFVVIDLKIGEIKHQDIGQMMMYVNYFDRYEKTKDEHKTVGIILCKDKSEALVKLTLPEENNQIYASKYLTVLPNKEEFKKLLEDTQDDENNDI